MRIDPEIVRRQLEQLRLLYPELIEDEDAWDLTLSSETDLDSILAQIVDRMRHAEAMAGGCATRIAETEVRQGRYERQQKAMRELAYRLMEAADIRKRELAEATLSIRQGTPKVIVTDEAIIPDILMRIKREPDKARIKDLLAAGQEVRGCTLSNGEPSISIRTK